MQSLPELQTPSSLRNIEIVGPNLIGGSGPTVTDGLVGYIYSALDSSNADVTQHYHVMWARYLKAASDTWDFFLTEKLSIR
jgi:hypothetical protein